MDIPLQHGIARVDDEDDALVRPFKWHSLRTQQGRVYAYTAIAGRRVYMHHLILHHKPQGRGKGDIDHVNGDGLDNRRGNLRKATRQQNNANTGSRKGTSIYKGVSWSRQHKAWQAHIMVDYKSRFLGLYETEDDAARAYDLAALAAFADYGRLNFPERIGEPAPLRFSTARARDLPDVAADVHSAGRSGASNPNAKLTDADVRRIIVELQAVPKRSANSIAAEFGVSTTAISRIASRKAWAHLWS